MCRTGVRTAELSYLRKMPLSDISIGSHSVRYQFNHADSFRGTGILPNTTYSPQHRSKHVWRIRNLAFFEFSNEGFCKYGSFSFKHKAVCSPAAAVLAVIVMCRTLQLVRSTPHARCRTEPFQSTTFFFAPPLLVFWDMQATIAHDSGTRSHHTPNATDATEIICCSERRTQSVP